jgi:hypothetical protein
MSDLTQKFKSFLEARGPKNPLASYATLEKTLEDELLKAFTAGHDAGYEAGYEAGRQSQMQAVENTLAEAIKAADNRNSYACMNQGTAAQVATAAEVRTLQSAFAAATGTPVNSERFQSRVLLALERAALARESIKAGMQANGRKESAERIEPGPIEVVPGWQTWQLVAAAKSMQFSTHGFTRDIGLALSRSLDNANKENITWMAQAFADILKPYKPSDLDGDRGQRAALLSRRRDAAETLFQDYDFDCSVEASNGWEYTSSGDEFHRVVYVKPEVSTDDEPTTRLNFTIMFEPGSDEPICVEAKDSSGNQWGARPQPSQPMPRPPQY